MKNKRSGVPDTTMNLPSLTTPEGLFDYLIGGIVLLATLVGLVLVAVAYGFF